MTTQYQDMKREVGKDVLKTLAFFFIAVPVALFLFVYFVVL
jgi:hypothetical protein